LALKLARGRVLRWGAALHEARTYPRMVSKAPTLTSVLDS
jgi:hypothetical protein